MKAMKFSDVKHAGFLSEKVNALAAIEFEKLVAKYGPPSCGRHRAAFISKHCVIKFPLCDKGIADNSYEATSTDEVNAKTKLINVGDFPCAIQERLVMPTSEQRKEFPSWTDFIDCCQVGFDKKGNLKAYDFGYF